MNFDNPCLKAAALMREGDFIQQRYSDKVSVGDYTSAPPVPGACYCIVGAICVANGWGYDDPNTERVVTAVAGTANLPVDDPFDAVFEWNDAPGRTKREVINLLAETARVMEAG